MRVEVHFSDGQFTAFPEVEQESLLIEGGKIQFKFLGHEAVVYEDKINFIEIMDDIKEEIKVEEVKEN